MTQKSQGLEGNCLTLQVLLHGKSSQFRAIFLPSRLKEMDMCMPAYMMRAGDWIRDVSPLDDDPLTPL